MDPRDYGSHNRVVIRIQLFFRTGQAEYYGKLTTRVLEITGNEKTDGQDVFITGHSLGGGLARIVGTLTGQGSVAFSPQAWG